MGQLPLPLQARRVVRTPITTGAAPPAPVVFCIVPAAGGLTAYRGGRLETGCGLRFTDCAHGRGVAARVSGIAYGVTGPSAPRPIRLQAPDSRLIHGEWGSVGLLKTDLCVFHRRSGQNDAGASDATAAVADGRFCARLRPSSKVGFFNSLSVLHFLQGARLPVARCG